MFLLSILFIRQMKYKVVIICIGKGAEKMSKHINKILLIVLIFIVTLGLLFGAYFFYKQFFVNQPLSVTLDNSELIAQYELINERKNPILKIKLQKNHDLSYEFQRFLKTGGEMLTEKGLQLELYSNPNPGLLGFYQEINPALYEALSLNNYVELQEILKEKNQDYGLTKASLQISEDYLFLQLEDGDNYLYYILNRHSESFPKIINNIGSDME